MCPRRDGWESYSLSLLSLLAFFPFPCAGSVLTASLSTEQKTRSAYLIGENHLGIAPLPNDSQTLPKRIPLPRIVTAQCDNISSIYLAGLLEELFGEDNGTLSKRLLSTTPLDTHIGYVALRILAQGTVWILVDKNRRDMQNSTNVRHPSAHPACFYMLTSAHRTVR